MSSKASPLSLYFAMKAVFLSFCYRRGRSMVVNFTYEVQKRERRARDLEEVMEWGDRMLRLLPSRAFSFPIPEGIGVHLFDLWFPSPLTLASFKDDLAVLNRWLMLGLGSITIKTIMHHCRDGNPRPRLQELPGGGFLNAMGLPCPGIEKRLEVMEEACRKKRLCRPDRPLGISIGGNCQQDYKITFERARELVERRMIPHFFEVNISCPNTSEGQKMSTHPGLLKEFLAFMREKSSAVIVVKLSPDMADDQIVSFASLVKEVDKTALNLGNTSYRTCEQVGLPPEAIAVGGGGLSGSPLYPRTLALTRLVAPLGVKIIATGGVDSAEKVHELQQSGATLVGLASAVVKDMYCIPLINARLAAIKNGA